MSSACPTIDTLIRPRSLVVAARHARLEYRRDALLPRLLGLPSGQRLPGPDEALRQLLKREAAMDAVRRRHDATWDAGLHVLVLAAMLAESAALARVVVPFAAPL